MHSLQSISDHEAAASVRRADAGNGADRVTGPADDPFAGGPAAGDPFAGDPFTGGAAEPPPGKSRLPASASAPAPEELALQAQRGDRSALAALCDRYAPLIKSAVRRYRGQRAQWDDLSQSACESFIRAVQNFDPLAGVFFGYYIRSRVMGGVRTVARRHDVLLSRSLPLDPTDFGVPQGDAREGGTLWPALEDSAAHAALSHIEWEELFATLTPRERAAVEWTVLRGYRLRDLATAAQVGRETVKTWRQRGLSKLRAALSRE